jgi:hypothetical protein
MVSLVGLAIASAATAWGGDTESDLGSLRGLRGLQVIVEVRPATEHEGLAAATIQTDVAQRLRQEGIRVLTEASSMLGAPHLYVSIDTEPGGGYLKDFYAVNIRVSLRQRVRLDRDPSIGLPGVSTWSAEGIGLVQAPRLVGFVRDHIRDHVDRFINAYRSVNPRPAPAPAR